MRPASPRCPSNRVKPTAEAEQAYRIATDIWPGNVEAASGLTALLMQTGRAEEARRLADDFARRFPQMRADLEREQAAWRFHATAPVAPAAPRQ